MDDGLLNLDELFGQATKIKVLWKGKEYELLSMEAMTPKQALQLQHVQTSAVALKVEDEPSDEGAAQLEKLMADMLRMLCNDLPIDDIPFAGKLAIMKFYVEQTQGKKALEAALSKPTGAASSLS